MVISQLNCSCNPVSPDAEQARQAHEAFELAFRLAEKLGVHTVGSFSGCPGRLCRRPNTKLDHLPMGHRSICKC